MKGMNKLKNTIMSKMSFVLLFVVMVSFYGCGQGKNSFTKENSAESTKTVNVITDMSGKKIELKNEISKISCIHPIAAHMIWRLAPNKLVNTDVQFVTRLDLMPEKEIERLKKLPVFNTYSEGIDTEAVLNVNPDCLITMTKDPNKDNYQEKLGDIPIIKLSKDTLQDYGKSFKIVGQVVGNEKEGNELSDYWNETLEKITKEVDKVKPAKKIRIYYAQPKANCTVGPKTIMASIIGYVGGENFYDTHEISSSQVQNESIETNMEDIVMWNPEIIIAKNQKAYDDIMSNPAWAQVDAVKNKKVYVTKKYSMLDRIQSIMGLMWTAKTVYPDINLDFEKEMKEFYSKVYLCDDISKETMDILTD